MGVRELLARAWGLTSWEPSEEHADDLALAATLDKMERLLCVADVPEGWGAAVAARLRRIADELDPPPG
jgi:hypothetical protein